ncbi:unnamed protein product [Mycena citricolor]|uniref:Uncharacterized protein n=1 Tax=Mycena citricolor TaxID=2018698 RepID=A0AAD2H3X2_9AGAR|nr:unnamed protein product [Mycena citricolor]
MDVASLLQDSPSDRRPLKQESRPDPRDREQRPDSRDRDPRDQRAWPAQPPPPPPLQKQSWPPAPSSHPQPPYPYRESYPRQPPPQSPSAASGVPGSPNSAPYMPGRHGHLYPSETPPAGGGAPAPPGSAGGAYSEPSPMYAPMGALRQPGPPPREHKERESRDRERDRDRERERERERERDREREQRERERDPRDYVPHMHGHPTHPGPPGWQQGPPPPHSAGPPPSSGPHVHSHHSHPHSQPSGPFLLNPPSPRMYHASTPRSHPLPPQQPNQRTFQGQFHTSFVPVRESSPPRKAPPTAPKREREREQRERERERERDRERTERERDRGKDREVDREREAAGYAWGTPATPVHAPVPGHPAHMHGRGLEMDWEPQHSRSDSITSPSQAATSQYPATVPVQPPEPPERLFRAKRTVSLGTYVYPTTPFPWKFVENAETLFSRDAEVEIDAKKEKAEKDRQDREKQAERERLERERLEAESKLEPGELPATSPNPTPAPADPVEDKSQDTKAQESGKAGDAVDDKELLDLEVRTTILVPSTHLPSSKPPVGVGVKGGHCYRLWGGGLGGNGDTLPSPEESDEPSPPPKRRRIYSDDSSVLSAAVHSGFIKWSHVARACQEGRDVAIEVRMVRVLGIGKEALAEGWHVGGSETPPSSSSAGPAKDLESSVAPEEDTDSGKSAITTVVSEVVGRFAGGWGAQCSVAWEDLIQDGSSGNTMLSEQQNSNSVDDGRSIMSAGWGSGHAGSAFEVVKVWIGEKTRAYAGSHTRSRQNRRQRMAEYTARRSALGLGSLGGPAVHPMHRQTTPRVFPCPRDPAVLAGKKRKRAAPSPPTTKAAGGNATVLDIIHELEEGCDRKEDEAWQRDDCTCAALAGIDRDLMKGRTIVCAFGDRRNGFKYDPGLLRATMFPPAQLEPEKSTDTKHANKRRRLSGLEEVAYAAATAMEDDVKMESEVPVPQSAEPQGPKSRSLRLQTGQETLELRPAAADTGTSAPRWKAVRLPSEDVVHDNLGESDVLFADTGIRMGSAEMVPVTLWCFA